MTGGTKGLVELWAGLFILSGALISAGPAFGQSATDQTTTAQTGEAAGLLQEVVVTAERRAENVQTTPISVVALSGTDLQAASVASVNDLQAVAPDLTVVSGGGSSTLTIRGLGALPIGIVIAGVAVVRDGLVNTTGGFGMDLPFYDMADVEVLRGPQGTFNGANSTGGAVDINSQNPNFRGISGYATAKVATYSDTGLQGAVNLPVTDTLAMRLAFNEERRGSFFYNEGQEFDGPNGEAAPYYIPMSPTCPISANQEAPGDCATSGDTGKTATDPGNAHNEDERLSLLWKPTDNFQSLTKIEFDDNATDGLATQPNINTFAPLAPGLPCPAGHGTAPNCTELYLSGYSGNPYILNTWDAGEKYDTDDSLYSEEFRYTLPSGTVARLIMGDMSTYETVLSNATADSIDIQDGNTNVGGEDYHIFTGEFDLISPTTGALSWVAGLAEYYQIGQLLSWTTNTAPPYSNAAPSHSFWTDGEEVYTKTEGVFGQTTWQINPKLQFQVGARVSWDHVTGHGATEVYRPGETPLFTHIPGQSPYGATENAVPTGKIGLNWTPVNGEYFYAFFARGYKPGQQNAGTKPPTTKEWVNDYEGGWKGTLAGGHLLTQVGAYYMQYYQMEESIFDIYNVLGTSNGNIPYSIVKGLEASMQSQLGHFGLNISADLNKSILGPIIQAKTYAFPSYVGITNQCAPGQTPTPTDSNCTDYTPYVVSLAGEALPYSPIFQGNATLQYTIPLGNMSLVPRVSGSYVSKNYTSLFDIPFNEIPAYGLVSAYVDWIAGPWTTTIFGTNLANRLYVTNIAATSEYFGNPRQLGLQVNRTF